MEVSFGGEEWLDGFRDEGQAEETQNRFKELIEDTDRSYSTEFYFGDTDTNTAKLDALKYAIASRVLSENENGSDDDDVLERQNAIMRAAIGDWELMSSLLKKDSIEVKKSAWDEDDWAGTGLELLSNLVLE